MRKLLGILIATLIIACNVASVEAQKMSFMDVKESDWYYEYVLDVYGKGLMKGYDENTFGSYDGLTRVQFVTILWKMAGSPKVVYDGKFPDVSQGL